jgi:hypothetical protein
MKKDKFIIQDWAGNVLDVHSLRFLRPNFAVPKRFTSFEAGWGWIYENIKEETEGDGTYDDVYVLPEGQS